MNTKIVTLREDLLVEVESRAGGPIADINFQRLNKGIDQLGAILKKLCVPLSSTWDELNKEVCIDSAEIEVGLSFEGEGNLFVAKSTAGANLQVKLTLKPKNS